MVTLMVMALVAATASIEPAAARVTVSNTGCAELSPDEVGRLLDIELSTVTSEIRTGPPLQVELVCGGERLTITIVDPLTRKRLARDIPAPANEPGRERVVALAISQLFAASWLELLTATPPPPPPPDDPEPPPDAQAVEAARKAAEASTRSDAEPDPSPPQRELELLVGVGGRGRGLQDRGRLAATRSELVLRGWARPSVGWLVLAGWDFGQATRPLGRVRGHAVTAGAGLCWGYRPGRVGVGGHLTAVAGWAQVRGLAPAPDSVTAANRGLTADATAGVGPRIRYGRLRFDLDAELGAMLRSPIGIVDGGPSMSMGGLWAGLTLRLGGAVR